MTLADRISAIRAETWYRKYFDYMTVAETQKVEDAYCVLDEATGTIKVFINPDWVANLDRGELVDVLRHYNGHRRAWLAERQASS